MLAQRLRRWSDITGYRKAYSTQSDMSLISLKLFWWKFQGPSQQTPCTYVSMLVQRRRRWTNIETSLVYMPPPPVIRSSCASSDLKPRIRHLTYHVTMTYDGKFEDVWKLNFQKPERKRQVSSRQNNYLLNVTATIQIIVVILWRIIYLIKWNWEYKYFDA